MHEKLKEYLKNKEKAQQAADQQLLFREGLYEKVYMQEGDDPAAFDCSDFSGDTERRYKRVAIPLTDEELELVRQAAKTKPQSAYGLSWGPVLILWIVAAFFVVYGLILWLSYDNFNDLVVLLFYGAIIYGLAEIVKRLEK